MHRIGTVDELEAVVGAPRQIVLMKSVDALDDGCRAVLAQAPIAGFGYRDSRGVSRTALVGGSHSFARVESPTQISFEISETTSTHWDGGAVSMIFLIPGIGETLRLNGVAERRSDRAVVDLVEAFVHCAKCIRRSKLWGDTTRPGSPEDIVNREVAQRSSSNGVADFLLDSPFILVSSWDATGGGDTSPRGDRAGFVRMLDESTLAIPDRKGNQRTDTFHNLLSCDEISLVGLKPGTSDALHVTGRGFVTTNADLLGSMAASESIPKAALVVCIDEANIDTTNEIETARLWDASLHCDPSVIDLIAISAEHLARSKVTGAKASMTRLVTRMASPKLVRRAAEADYRRDLRNEGHET